MKKTESKWKAKKKKEESKCEAEREREREGEGGRGSAERKRLYLHEAYLGSRLQNNGRKRVHGTFPSERACVPLSRVSWPPRSPAVSRDVTLCWVVWTGQRRREGAHPDIQRQTAHGGAALMADAEPFPASSLSFSNSAHCC